MNTKEKLALRLAPMLCAAAVLAAFVFGSAPAAALGNTLRLGGSSRIETALRISDEGWGQTGAKTVIVANGYNYPDAMAGVPLASILDAPILLTSGQTPEQDVLDQLKKLSAENVLILGGTGSVSAEFEGRVRLDTGCYVERISGDDRYATAAAVAERMVSFGALPAEVFVASGTNYPDALSVSPAAGVLGQPILYTDPAGNLSDGELEFIRECGVTRAVILGGEAAVPSAAVQSLESAGVTAVERLSGPDRYRTSLAVNQRYSDILSGSDVAIASGKGFPDALSGGAFAARKAIPVVLLSDTAHIPGAYEFVYGREPQNTYVFGRENALSAYAVSTFLSGGTITTTTTTTATAATATTTAKPAPTGMKAYLTFDDGPSANTAKILDILDKYSAKATFFVIYRAGYESTYKEIVSRGHTIALHSYTHNYATIYKSEDAYFSDLNRLSDYIAKVTGVRSKIMRFPGGGSNTVSIQHSRGIMTRLTTEVQRRGYRYYDWNVDSGDADAATVKTSTLISNIKKRCGTQKTAMILMHDAPSKTTTVAALPDIIGYLRAKGYELLPITADTPQIHHGVNN